MRKNIRSPSREFIGKGAAQAIQGPLYGDTNCVDTVSSLNNQLLRERQKRQELEAKMNVLLSEIDDIKHCMNSK